MNVRSIIVVIALFLIVALVTHHWITSTTPLPANSVASGETETVVQLHQKAASETGNIQNQLDQLVDSGSVNQNPELAEDVAIVQGQIVNNLQQGISGIKVEISLKAASGWQKDIYSALSASDGSFIVEAVPPDMGYRLEVLALGAYKGALLDPFPVEHNMEPVIISLDSLDLVSVDGMIVDTDNLPVPEFELLVRNIGLNYPGSKIVSDSSGFFQLSEFPAGDLQFSTDGDEHFKINGIEIQQAEYKNLLLVVDKGSYSLAGRVVDEFGSPISQARVVLTAMISRADLESTSYRLILTDRNGKFDFTGLGGQAHKLVVDAPGFHSFLTTYEFVDFSNTLEIQLQGF